MAKEKALYMTFKNAIGNTCTISVDDPREDLEEEDVIEAMENIITNNIFLPKGYDITTAVSAKVVDKVTTEYDLEV